MSFIAHRGLPNYSSDFSRRPENSLSAFKRAYELGLTYGECDIILTLEKV